MFEEISDRYQNIIIYGGVEDNVPYKGTDTLKSFVTKNIGQFEFNTTKAIHEFGNFLKDFRCI